MPPDVPNENGIEHNDVEVTESRDVIETAAEVEPEMSKESSGAQQDLPVLTTVSWFRQLRTVLRKNILLLSRRPLMLIVMLLSSVVSVLLAWAAGRPNPDYDFGKVPLTDCGTVSSTYYDNLTYTEQSETPISFNDAWRYGMPVTLLALGPLVTAIAAFLLVHEEMSQKMLGVLRGLGLRDSVYWMAWILQFSAIALVNSLLGGLVAKLISVHVFQHVYYTGIFGTLFFLQLAMIATSLFCAALCSTSRKCAPWLILVMLVVLWVPYITINAQSAYVTGASSVTRNDYLYTPSGLFWFNANTTWYSYGEDGGACDKPLITEEQGNFWKTTDEQEEYLSSPEDFFMGCYFGAGYTNYFWNPSGGKFGSAVLFLFPYTHFFTTWGNFLGYTGMPDRSFDSQHASMSAEQLAVASLTVPPNDANAKGSSLYPQGSTFNMALSSPDYDSLSYTDSEGNKVRRDNCPWQNSSEFFCPNISQCTSALNPAPTDSPSMNQMFGFLTVLAIIYTLLAAYWAQVFPGDNGAPRKFYFFLLPSYWCGGCMKKSSNKDDSSADAVGVVVNDVRKQYGNFEALKGVSMKMERGEVTAVLGHNGAGKTTLSSIICCEISPTEGDVTVFGYSVSKDPYAVRNLVGICKQDDYLYPDLSAKEHLELFAGLRGVRKDKVAETVQTWLESVDLATVQEQYSKSFSGGMKRRLSVACSTIGDRPCIVLDEPTTGMDPVSRRFVWDHIESIKEGRLVLLTTHAMEEADLLCDTVAVMRKGEVAAFGSPLSLKSEFGTALQFSLLVERDDTAATKQAILERFDKSLEWVAVDAGEAGNITVKIQCVRQGKSDDGIDVDDLANFVSWLESDDSAVTEYGFSNSSLEEVFLKVTEGSEEEEEDNNDVDVCCACCCSCCVSCCLSGPCRCCCRPNPHVHQSDPTPTDGDETVQSVTDEAVEVDEDAAAKANAISTYQPQLTAWRQAVSLFWFSMKRSWTGKGSIANWIVYSLFVLVIILVGVFTAGSSSPPIAPLVIPVALLTLMLLSIISAIYSDRQLGLFYLIRTQGLIKRAYLLGTSMYSLTIMFLYGFVALSLFYATPLFRDPYVCPQGEAYCVHSGGPPIVYPVPISWWEDEYNGEQVQLYAAPTTGSYARILGAIVFFALTMPGAVLASSYVPGFKFALVLIVFIALFVSVLPLAFYISTGRFDDYDITKCASNICDVSALDSLSIDNLGSTGKEFLNCVGFSVNFSSSLGGLCLAPVAAILPQFGLFQTLAMTVISDVILVSDPPEYVEQVLVPNIGGDVSCSGNTCVFPYAKKLYGANLGFMAVGAIILLIIGITLVSVYSFPNGFVLQFKNRASHLFGRLCCFHRAIGNRSSHDENKMDDATAEEPPLDEVVKENEYVESVVKPLLKSPDPEHVEEGYEELVIADHDDMPRDELPPVLMYKLRKVYPSLGGLPPKVALESMDLHVPKGQVLGLLGKNGAGKTTALKILSISHKATSGVALVAGYDVSCKQLNVFEHLGNCAQFDIIWRGQSVQTHLEFFARLKGLPKRQVQDIALSIAKAVGLGAPEVYRRSAGALSGGMRRRLSIAMSLIGAPSVLLLDEPSTGLDPSTRNSIWGLVSSFATEERAIIITTHQMIEADTLCNRIAIVSRGNLKVVGTQQHLKDEFGSGYLLQLNLMKSTPSEQQKAMDFVRSRLSKDAVLQTKQAKTLHIALPRDIDLTRAFRALYSLESQTDGCINQFLLSQSSLEDVFIALGDD